jgi:hypothetical protein
MPLLCEFSITEKNIRYVLTESHSIQCLSAQTEIYKEELLAKTNEELRLY